MSRAARCRSCRAPIRWVVTDANRVMPIDELADPERGNVVRLGTHRGDGMEYVEVFRNNEAATFYAAKEGLPPPHLSHFVTCAHASQHRRKK